MRAFLLNLIWIVSLGMSCICSAQDLEDTFTGELSLKFQRSPFPIGQEITGIVELTIPHGWHLYWKNPGETGFTPVFDWTLPKGLRVERIDWPVPKRFQENLSAFYGYDETVQWVVSFRASSSLVGHVPIQVSLFGLACNSSCVPFTKNAGATIAFSSSGKKEDLAFLKEARDQLPLPLVGGSATLRERDVLLRVPVEGDIQQVLLFPEKSGVISPVDHLEWKREEGYLEIEVSVLDQAHAILEEDSEFHGLVQLFFGDTTKSTTYAVSLPISVEVAETLVPLEPEKEIERISYDERTLYSILLLAFLGGVILNITPCVLPVIGIRVLHLLSIRDEKKFMVLHGLAFTVGVLLTFFLLASGLYLLQYFGHVAGWGFQLQNPIFVSVLILILFLFSLNLFGVFEIGSSLSSWAADVEGKIVSSRRPSYVTSFVHGLFVTIIATPCTGPLLGSVFGFAATVHPFDGVLLFSSIGLGMAMPFLLLTCFPAAIRLLPKSGAWVIGVKEFFGFCLLATALWLLWVLEAEVMRISLSLLLLGPFLMAFAVWLWNRWKKGRVRAVRYGVNLVAVLCFGLGLLLFFFSFESPLSRWIDRSMRYQSSVRWEQFSEDHLEEALQDGKIVFVSFTARWCLSCQLNKPLLSSSKLAALFHTYDVVAMEADWTTGDERITKFLRRLDRNGIPVYAVFAADHDPILLSEFLSLQEVEEVVQSLKSTK